MITAPVDERLTFTLWLALAHTGTMLAVWAVLALCLKRGVGARLEAAPGKAPPRALMRRAVREMLRTQVVFAVLAAFVVYPAWRAMGGLMSGALPAIGMVALHLLAFILIQDTIFYWSHRALHTPFLFRHVHVIHHRFVYVRGPVAEYSHPIEGFLNFVAFVAGPIAFGTPFPVFVLWVVLRMAETVEAHGGYMLTPWSKRHAFHHLRANGGCYGSFLSPWDIVLGTDRAWRRWQAARRGPAVAAGGRAPR